MPDSSLPGLLSFPFTQTITWILDRIFYCYFLETLRQYVDTHTQTNTYLRIMNISLIIFEKKWFQLLLFHFFHLLYVVFVRVLKFWQEQFYQYIAQLQKYLYMQKNISGPFTYFDFRPPETKSFIFMVFTLFSAHSRGSNATGTYLVPYDLR